MNIPQPVIIAFNHVKEKHPELSIIIFDRNGRWCYMDEDFNALNFDNRELLEDDAVNVGILEDASDSVLTLPFIYQP